MNKTKKAGNVYPFRPRQICRLKKCLFCGTNEDLLIFRDHIVCQTCVQNIRQLYVSGQFSGQSGS